MLTWVILVRCILVAVAARVGCFGIFFEADPVHDESWVWFFLDYLCLQACIDVVVAVIYIVDICAVPTEQEVWVHDEVC